MKKSDLIAIGVILVLISIIVSACLNFAQLLIHGFGPYEVRDFRSYKKDFKMMAETAISFYDEEKEKNDALIYITIDTLNDTWKIRCVSEAEETDTYKEISEEESREGEHESVDGNMNRVTAPFAAIRELRVPGVDAVQPERASARTTCAIV